MAAHATRCDQVPGQDAQLAGPGGEAGWWRGGTCMCVWGGAEPQKGRRAAKSPPNAGQHSPATGVGTSRRLWDDCAGLGEGEGGEADGGYKPSPLPPQVRQAKRDLAWTRQREQWIAGAAAGVHLALFSFNLAFWGFEGTPPDRYNPSNIRYGGPHRKGWGFVELCGWGP